MISEGIEMATAMILAVAVLIAIGYFLQWLENRQ